MKGLSKLNNVLFLGFFLFGFLTGPFLVEEERKTLEEPVPRKEVAFWQQHSQLNRKKSSASSSAYFKNKNVFFFSYLRY